MKVLVATEKPFAKVAVDGIRKEVEAAGYELALLEKYTEKAQLLEAVKDANAIIIRSDIIDNEVFDAAPRCPDTTPVSRHLNKWVSYHPPKMKKDAQTFYKSVRPSQYAAMRQRFFFYGSGDPNV